MLARGHTAQCIVELGLFLPSWLAIIPGFAHNLGLVDLSSDVHNIFQAVFAIGRLVHFIKEI
jgi:hypothetical protein